jgi:excisionase family DNA binding protein
MFKRDFCTTREAAEMLGVSLRTAQLWVDSGILEAWKTEGGHRRINLGSVERLLRDDGSRKSPVSATPSAPPVELGLLKILVVEDDNTLLKLYRLQLNGWNLPIQVTTAANGYDALVLIGREQPDLMIADLNMPGMDGFQMVRAVSSSSFREGMEIVVVTGLEESEILARGGLPQGVRTMQKPIPFPAIKSLVEGMIARRRELLSS